MEGFILGVHRYGQRGQSLDIQELCNNISYWTIFAFKKLPRGMVDGERTPCKTSKILSELLEDWKYTILIISGSSSFLSSDRCVNLLSGQDQHSRADHVHLSGLDMGVGG